MLKGLGIFLILLIVLSACGGTAQDDPIKKNCKDTNCQTAPTPPPTTPPIATPTPGLPEVVVPGLQALSQATGATPEFIMEAAADYGYTDFTALPVNSDLVEFLVKVSEANYGDAYLNLLKQNYTIIHLGNAKFEDVSKKLKNALVSTKLLLLPLIELTTSKDIIDILNEEKPDGIGELVLNAPTAWQQQLFPLPEGLDPTSALANVFKYVFTVYYATFISVRIDGACYTLFQFNADSDPNDQLRGSISLVQCKDSAFTAYFYE
ncbi:MAG: hypothetical protein HYU97_00270 [Deltaproteobacteria bacterium]|nr:hypothetical protein [Deltaproteobacteria bacterium]